MSDGINTNEAIQEMVTIRDFIRWAVTQFNQADLVYGHGTDNGWDEAVNLILTTLHLPPDIDTNVLDAKLVEAEKRTIAERVKRRVEERIPVPYLVNEAWFAGYNFYVDERVVIPRSPVAELLEDEFSPWVEEGNVQSILDLCTGSACIAISAAFTFPDATVDAVDISANALEVAKINVERFGLEENVHLIQSDLFTALTGKQYDIIISNPPYVSKAEYDALPPEYTHEPQQALACGEEGLEIIRRILAQAENYLTPTGILIVEVGFSQEALEAHFPGVPFTWLQFEHGGEGVFLLTADELREFRHLIMQ
ncbi:MAG: ribosomal protein L3 N(5)-glutamine methyltransferase [Gammaproteobacteria bacterium 39-13]|nr:50S ribosomal protein L3 N(5)-glutamine methyltransferase [Gammaproteobacteria bacterium]OJV94964.1 MAG: ribosomal protein L3 N(5)-glutamine methyltransferase [Gammaproteobacteria bacterium 39-13]